MSVCLPIVHASALGVRHITHLRILPSPQELAPAQYYLNPYNVKATFIQSTMTQVFWKPSEPCRSGIHWIAFAEYSQMSTNFPGLRSFFNVLRHFLSAKLTTSSIMVNSLLYSRYDVPQIFGCTDGRY